MMQTIKIKGQEYKIKQSFRALMEFEKLAGKNAYAADASVSDSLQMYYCLLLANNPEFKYTFDQFLELLDEDETLLPAFHEYLASLVQPEKAVADKKKAETR